MVYGYVLSARDTNEVLNSTEHAGGPRCGKCGCLTDHEYISPHARIREGNAEVWSTYDGHLIVRERFRRFCVDAKYAGLVFKELPNNPGCYSLFVHNVLPFDTEKTPSRSYDYCDSCGRYKSVGGLFPFAIKGVVAPIEAGFFATDIHFGDCSAKRPVPFLGCTTKEELEKQRFKGIVFIQFDSELSVPWKKRAPAK